MIPKLPLDPDAATEASEGPVSEAAEGELGIPGKPMGTGDTIRPSMPAKPAGHPLRGPNTGRRVYDD